MNKDKKCKKECGCPPPKKEKVKENCKKKESRNGKGDSPRNVSDRFKENYDDIDWSKKT